MATIFDPATEMQQYHVYTGMETHHYELQQQFILCKY